MTSTTIECFGLGSDININDNHSKQEKEIENSQNRNPILQQILYKLNKLDFEVYQLRADLKLEMDKDKKRMEENALEKEKTQISQNPYFYSPIAPVDATDESIDPSIEWIDLGISDLRELPQVNAMRQGSFNNNNNSKSMDS